MNDPQIDLTGKLIIKVQLGDDIRRILITNEDITYDELVLMMQRVYRGKLSSTDDIVIKYKDEDNDLITIFDSSDLTFATQCSRILKITLFVNGKPEPLQSSEVKHIKKQLQQIRDQCNSLLDRLDDHVVDTLNVAADSTGTMIVSPMVTDSPNRPSPVPRMAPQPSTTAVNTSKEFDPLSTQKSVDDSQQNKVISSFGIGNDISSTQERPGTPDSLTSIGSSSSNTLQVTPQDPQKHAPSPSQQPITQPAQPGGTGMYGGPSLPPGQKAPPWQQQNPSHQSAGPALPNQPQYSAAQPGYPGAGGQSSFPGQTTSQPQTSQPGFGTPSSQYGYGAQQGGASQPSAPGPQPGQGQGQMFGQGQGQPGFTGQPQQSGQQAPQQSQYAGFGQQQPGTTQQQQPGIPQQQQPGMPQQQQQPGMPQQQQPGMPPTQQQSGMPPQQQQQPTGPAPGGQSGQPSGPPTAGGASNPYARPSQGPGYPSGYPRPAGNYQGYQ